MENSEPADASNILSLRSGTIGRAPYFVAGVCLLAIKFGVDRIISRVFERPWSPAEYIVPGASLGMLIANPQDRLFYTTLAIGAVPFIAMGVWLTVLRLRSIGVSPAWSILFFAPVINFALFAILTALPERIRKGNVVSDASIPPASKVPQAIPLSYSQIPARPFASLDRLLPANPTAMKAVAVLVPAFVGLAVTVLSVQFLSTYGWGVFVGVPFCIGLMAAILFAVRGAPSLSSCIGIGCASLTVYGVLLILCAFEGAVCILMAAPLAYPVAILGALVGSALAARPDRVGDARQVMSATLLFLPMFIGAEKLAAPEAQTFVVTSSIDVDAPPEKVWANVIGFGQIPPPTELVFRSGIAYPIRAEIVGRGPRRVRRCVFSTGAFVEPITDWNEPRLLKFAVTSNPPPLDEWSPYSSIHPPHLDDFLVSNGGQFELTALSGDRTAPRRHYLVQTSHVARFLLAALVRLDHPPNPPARAQSREGTQRDGEIKPRRAQRQSRSRSFTNLSKESLFLPARLLVIVG